MPLAFLYASVVACLTAIRAGATIVLQDRFRAEEIMKLILAGRLTAIMGVPTMYRLLLEAAPARSTFTKLRFCASAGDSLSRDLVTKFERIFGWPLFEFYGLTEAPHVFSHTIGVDRRSRPHSCGRPLRDVRVRIVDESGHDTLVGEVGEAIIQTPWMFLEYFRNPQATTSSLRHGWFSTGDFFRSDEDGYLYMVGRKKELIKRGGFNVLPGEIEDRISAIPGVAEVAVIGIPDKTLGERVRAYVVRSIDSELTEETILRVCTEHLAKYKIPEEIKFVIALPKGPTGKVSRQTLRSQGHT
jgi:long-chain acyl-CoA synthetase